MNEDLKKRIAQLNEHAKAGIFGVAAQTSTFEYEGLENQGMSAFLKLINDFYQKPKNTEEDKMMANMADNFCQLMIVVYRDAKKQDEKVALAFANSFIKDFPGTTGTCLYPQWEALVNASYAFKNAPSSNNSLLVWQQSLKLVQAYNEFLNVLLGYLLVTWRCALGKPYSLNVLTNTYGSKLNEFSQLTDGEDGAFYLIFRLAKPDLRNAIAHEDIWLDSKSATVRYSAGKNPKKRYKIDLGELVGLGAMGANLGQAFTVALATIIVLEDGTAKDIEKLPAHLVQVFRKI
ncbi:hypothetical protein [Candidatus Leptofilum sp.]|uniref:hypothetical protein n=1 Tax=Candidatus Leptofilum sp. TaxID=3241576 RepID=UPI003B5912E7